MARGARLGWQDFTSHILRPVHNLRVILGLETDESPLFSPAAAVHSEQPAQRNRRRVDA